VRTCLNDSSSPYYSKSYGIFLQGSYGNDTNIYSDSDVDVIIKLESTFYKDLSNLNASELDLYNSAYSSATYEYDDFKRDVIAQLKKEFGSSVKPGKKAIFVESNGYRRDADVVAASAYRKYISFKNLSDNKYIEGICFWTTDGTQIINYPKQHSANCTTKHQNTGNWFKPTVRILKNMRNAMVSSGYLEEGIAPSYFLEGMLYNVPNQKFGQTYGRTLISAIDWIANSNYQELVCANEQYFLLHSTSPVTWRAENMRTYLNAFLKYWNR
jgi:hypothetical protein